jgi:hypothetical protein
MANPFRGRLRPDVRASRNLLRVLLGATVIVAVVVTALYAVRPAPTLAHEQSDTFTVGTAILVAGYFVFPVLALVAAALLLIALMLLAGAAIERRRLAGEAVSVRKDRG